MFRQIAFFLTLGVERVLYGYIYQYPNAFKRTCKGPLKAMLEDKKTYWAVAQHLGILIKVFQFGTIAYDVFIHRGWITMTGFAIAPSAQFCIGVVLAVLGQYLSYSVYRGIGGIGVYYGSQLGYEVPWFTGFPYNMGIPDPQYWGVVTFIWGMYLAATPSFNIFSDFYFVPWLELFWYVVSMKLLENSKNWKLVTETLGLPRDVPAE